jgi:hypothetical protein
LGINEREDRKRLKIFEAVSCSMIVLKLNEKFEIRSTFVSDEHTSYQEKERGKRMMEPYI